MSRRSRAFFALATVAAGALAWILREPLLGAAGGFLVRTDAPRQADIVVALAGGSHGERVIKAAELVELGYAQKVLVNGAQRFYGIDESRAATDLAAARGVPPEILEPFKMEAASTLEELMALEPELLRRGTKRALVVTSSFHTRRARSIFRRFGSGEIEYMFIAAPWPDFDPDNWWKSRAGRKLVLLEYLKTVNSLFENPPE